LCDFRECDGGKILNNERELEVTVREWRSWSGKGKTEVLNSCRVDVRYWRRTSL